METGKNLILITGATGQQGGAITRELLAKGHKVRAMTRDPQGSAAGALEKLGAEIVQGDLDDAASLERALAGAWGAFGVQNTWEAGVEKEEVQGKRLAEVAKQAGVRHYVYASVASAHRKTGIPHFDNKWRIEETVRGLGFPSYTILRSVFFMENFLGPYFLPGIQQGTLGVAIAPTTRLQMIAVADIGKYGVRAFEQHENLAGQAIDIAGDVHTMPEIAKLLTAGIGREVQFESVPIEAIRAFSEDYAIMLEWFDRVGFDADIPSRAKESGIAPTSFADWARGVKWTVESGAAQA
ncbi:MAG: NmrA/HSCARG family protein [Candidatus Eisenbacteria bacterium]